MISTQSCTLALTLELAGVAPPANTPTQQEATHGADASASSGALDQRRSTSRQGSADGDRFRLNPEPTSGSAVRPLNSNHAGYIVRFTLRNMSDNQNFGIAIADRGQAMRNLGVEMGGISRVQRVKLVL